MLRVLPSVIVDKRLVERLRKRATPTAKSYAIGKNANGVVVKAIRLKKTAGCSLMPATDPKNVALAAIELWKRGLIPCGYARVKSDVAIGSSYGSYELRGYRGQAFCLVISKQGLIEVNYSQGENIIHRNWDIIQYTKGGEKSNGKKHQRKDR